MTNTQVTLVQIDNYGPWTTTPEPRPEPDLQTLQARLYADLAQAVAHHGGYAFYHRFDNMVAITNGLDREAHAGIQESIDHRYPVTVSMGVGVDPVPATALGAATRELQSAGSAQDDGRRRVLAGRPLPAADRTAADLQIAHFDVNDATGTFTDELDAFASLLRIQRAYLSLAEHLYDRHGGLAFFVGGDNVIAVLPDLEPAAYGTAIDHVDDATDVELKVGVGEGPTAREAGMAAKRALEACRANGTRVEHAPAAWPSD